MVERFGITRLDLGEPRFNTGCDRFKFSESLRHSANDVYRKVFADLGCPLISGDTESIISPESPFAILDNLLGIDVILEFECGLRATLQEKFLRTHHKTITVEYEQNTASGERGDWFYMLTQYYFVGYDREGIGDFQEWVLIDWPALVRLTARGRVPWRTFTNSSKSCRASLKSVNMADIPDECLISKKIENS